MSLTPIFSQITSPAQAQAEVIVNQALGALQHQAVYAIDAANTSGLNLRLLPGRWAGFAYTGSSPIALTDAATNYVVVNRADGVPSASTSDTNWNNTDDYARAYLLVTAVGSITWSSAQDHRAGTGGVHGPRGGGGGGDAIDVDYDNSASGLAAVNVQEAIDELAGSGGGGGGREILTAARTYYVRPDGSDSNNGLANTSGGAFLTIQKALNVAGTLDVSIYQLTIEVADGTYSENLVLPWYAGTVVPILRGNISTPSNVLINPGSGINIRNNQGRSWSVRGMRLVSASYGILVEEAGSRVTFENFEFGACTIAHMAAFSNGQIVVGSNYSITGGAGRHWYSVGVGSSIVSGSRTITLTGTPAFGTAFADATRLSTIIATSNTYSGSATGKRYDVTKLSLIDVNGAGVNALPGNAAGTVATGAQYV
jgi:hypothetical protein